MKKRSLQRGGGTSIPDYEITDLATFNNVTSDPHQVAGLYFYSILDCLVELAYKLSHLFFYSPWLFVDLTSPTIPPLVAELHARYGSSEFLPNTEQRSEIYKPIFGRAADYSSEEGGNFPRLRDDLFGTAAAFTERAVDTGEKTLLGSVRIATRLFRDYLIGLYGDSVKWSREHALPHLTEEVSYTILRNIKQFGITPPVTGWPYTEDSKGATLVEAISKQLIWSDKPDEMCITRELFSNLQSTALTGAVAIATVIDFQDNLTDDDLELLIGQVYKWKRAREAVLMSLNAHAKPAQPTAVEEESRLAVGHTTLYKAV